MAIVGALLLILGGMLPWFGGPLRAGSSPTAGVVVSLVGLAAAGALIAGRRPWVFVAGTVGLALCLHALLGLALTDAALWDLFDEVDQYRAMTRFSESQLPANRMYDSDFLVALETTTADRLVAAFRFTSGGWWLCVLGASLLCAGNFLRPDGPRLRWAALVGALLAALVAGLPAIDAVEEKRLTDLGDSQQSNGAYREAVRSYERAMAACSSAAADVTLHMKLGMALQRLGRRSQPSALLQEAEQRQRDKKHTLAIFSYTQALDAAAEPLRGVVARRLAWTRAEVGLSAYRNGNLAGAALEWERARVADPSQAQFSFYLGKVYMGLGRHREAASMSESAATLVRDRSLQANAYANAGDAYSMIGEFDKARRSYAASLRADSKANYWALKRLGGT